VAGMTRKDRTVERGQAYTLQGVLGAILVASSLILGLQMVSIEPWTSDGTEQGTEIRTGVVDSLEIAQDREALSTAATCLGGSDGETPNPGLVATDPAVAEFGRILENTIDDSNSVAIYIDYPESGDIEEVAVGPDVQPTSSSVTVTRQVPLYDSDPVLTLDAGSERCVRTADNLSSIDSGDIYLENQDPNSDLYAVVQIRVVAW